MNKDNILEILYDIKNGEKEVDWRKRRLLAMRLAQAYKRIKSPKYHRIIDCASSLGFRRYTDKTLKLCYANFCQIRLCPMCNWRRSKKLFAQISRIMDDIRELYGFVFLTLTVKNCKGNDLIKSIDDLVSAFKTLCLRKQFKQAVKGWVKCFEVSFNWNTKEFHPHYHCILAVDKNYFKSKLYINQNDWCELWRSCLGVDYKPIVDVRAFTESEKGKGKEVAEVAKYTIKSSNIMANLTGISSYGEDVYKKAKEYTNSITDEIIITLDKALANRRLIGYGGVFKEKHKELDLSDVDDDLIHTEVDSVDSGLDFNIERYHWNIKRKVYVQYESDLTKGGEGK